MPYARSNTSTAMSFSFPCSLPKTTIPIHECYAQCAGQLCTGAHLTHRCTMTVDSPEGGAFPGGGSRGITSPIRYLGGHPTIRTVSNIVRSVMSLAAQIITCPNYASKERKKEVVSSLTSQPWLLRPAAHHGQGNETLVLAPGIAFRLEERRSKPLRKAGFSSVETESNGWSTYPTLSWEFWRNTEQGCACA